MNSLLLIAALLWPPADIDGGGGSVARAVITDANGQPVPEAAPLGEAVVFSAKRSVHGGKPGSVKWLISPPQRDARKYVSDDGLEVFIPTGVKPVVIEAILAVSLGDTVDVLKIAVKCGEGDIPPPDPRPDPRPDPKPDDPTPPTPQPLDSPLGLVRVAYEARKSIPANATIVEAEGMFVAKAHADAVKEFAVKWPVPSGESPKAKPYTLISQLHGSRARRVAESLDDSAKDRWANWSRAVNAKLDALQTNGDVETVEDWMRAYLEIANGVGRK